MYSEREQVSMFILGNTILTIQEGKEGDCWEKVRTTLENPKSKLRQKDGTSQPNNTNFVKGSF
jgi:hypothetical protein